MSEKTYEPWTSPLGLSTLKSLVPEVVSWPSLKDFQLDILAHVMNGENCLGITATGDGKTASYHLPLQMIDRLMQKGCPEGLKLHHRPARRAIGVVVSPLLGLEVSLVRLLIRRIAQFD